MLISDCLSYDVDVFVLLFPFVNWILISYFPGVIRDGFFILFVQYQIETSYSLFLFFVWRFW